MHNGKIVEIDKHKNLLKKSKIYKNLYELQFKKKNDKKIFSINIFKNLQVGLLHFTLKVCFNTSLWYLKNDEEITSVLKKKKN